MSLEFDEYYGYTAEQVKGHVDEAIRIVNDLGVPTDLRVAAFERACALLSQKQRQPKVPEALKGLIQGHGHG